MILNHRVTRISVGILLLAVAIAVLLPDLTGYTSLDGTVNARFAIINSPIDGEISKPPPRIGTPVTEGETLAVIRNDRVNRAILASLRAEHGTAVERVAALRRERDELALLRDELGQRMGVFQSATIASLERELAILQKRVEVSRAQDVVAKVDLDRRQELESKGIFTRKMVEAAEAAGAATGGEVEISNLTVDLLQQRLEAVRQGIFVMGDGQNDVPYSRQRQDEVIVRINDLDTRIAENETRASQAAQQLTEEEKRVRSLESATIPSPFGGVVWSRNVVSGSNVVLNNEMMRILDCRELFVDILVPEVDYDEIYPGREAEVRLFGRGDVFKGKVQAVKGSSAVVEKDSLAANEPETEERSARIRVALAPSALNADFANFCQVGRTAQVRFSKRNIRLTRWFESLWFNLF
ncbi:MULTISPECIES: HlyD family secretion protein [Sinorhizobium]|uniref:Multidrug resistance efflux pump n=1 Tax=Sinorhizobium americanum TaxID=194963 RepID=A0A1L3LXY4_9HYPH|nr:MULTISPECIES: efflux RND transporter periplasmic adaptor subunit [Sinorhizobium]APG94911.1 multidrug resistance efflux pump [Sinorhizobium americanum]OAP37194.1 hemolysin D [Sinorhizobium americanum]PDT53213.1 hemolysin D [Sinorhizobium sp. NG07B]POH29379.1 hemolysin D [Sinorhizobium americanum]TCN33162.1 multidrug resistance efflux pump [Sinorhizobium americanum]